MAKDPNVVIAAMVETVRQYKEGRYLDQDDVLKTLDRLIKNVEDLEEFLAQGGFRPRGHQA